MFLNHQILGFKLPYRSLCLTFDDGPGESAESSYGPKTLELAQFLHDECIPATFFMVGRFIKEHQRLVKKVFSLGHTIANHTYSHSRSMPELLSVGQNIEYEIDATDKLIFEICQESTIYFRAPWGLWSESVASQLNRKLNNEIDHIGPIYWDIDGADWNFWLNDKPAGECANEYLKQIQRVGRGIVLMHDSSADLKLSRENNKTLQTVRILVPRLKEHGYKFVGIKSIKV